VCATTGTVIDVTDPALGVSLEPGGLRAIKHDRGILDTFPLSPITTHSIARLGEMIGISLEAIDLETPRLKGFSRSCGDAARQQEMSKHVIRCSAPARAVGA
jgi:hypothetical protein